MLDIKKLELTLETGGTVWYEYDVEGDLLEIIFRREAATCAVELTEGIVLHFDWETAEPLSLSLISFSSLIQPAEYGEVYFQLHINEFDRETQNKVWAILRQPPLNTFLKLGSYAPSPSRQFIPIASVKSSDMLPVVT